MYRKGRNVVLGKGLEKNPLVRAGTSFLATRLKSDLVEIEEHKIFLSYH